MIRKQITPNEYAELLRRKALETVKCESLCRVFSPPSTEAGYLVVFADQPGVEYHVLDGQA